MNIPTDMHEEVLNLNFFSSWLAAARYVGITSVIDDDAKLPPVVPQPATNATLHHETVTPSGCPVVRRRGEGMRGNWVMYVCNAR